MIFTERTITIRNDSSSINAPVILYRGDKNVEVRFTLVESPYKYSNRDSINIIESTDASYAQLVIKTPNGRDPIFGDITAVGQSNVIFMIGYDMIDEIEEVGTYDFQIRLFDADQTSMATIPEVTGGFIIKEPIAKEDSNNNITNSAIVGSAVVTSDVSIPTFVGGSYNKTAWDNGTVISRQKLDKIEDGIYESYELSKNNSSQIKDKATKTELEVERKRIDNLTKLPEGSTAGDAELIDARIGVDGVTYSNLGNAIRNQVNNLNENIDFFNKSISVQMPYNVNILNGQFEAGLFSSTTGLPQSDLTENAWIRCNDYYSAKDNITIVSNGNSSSICMFCYDSDNNYIGLVTQDAISKKLNLLDGTVKVKFAFYGGENFSFNLDNLGTPILVYGDSVSTVNDELNILNEIKVDKTKIFEHSEPMVSGNGYWYNLGVSTTQNAGHTELFFVYGYEKIKAYTNISSAAYAIALFDKNKTLLKDISVPGNGKKEYNVDLSDTMYKNVYYASVSYYDATQTYDGFYAIAYNDDCLSTRIAQIESMTKRHYNTFSIIGDSYSSFEGYMVDSSAKTWYPASLHGNDDTNDVENVEQTWWYKFANKYNSRLIENNSWSGSAISYDGYGDGTSDGKSTSFITRADKLTTPELIIVFGGTNDEWVANDAGTTSTFLGDYKYSDWTETDLEKFRPSLACLIDKIQHKNIGATIIFMLNSGLFNINESVEVICEHYGVQLLKLSNIDKAHSHPTEAGMTSIANQLIDFLS